MVDDRPIGSPGMAQTSATARAYDDTDVAADGTLGKVGSQGVAHAPMADTHTAETAECEVQAGASDTEGCGMDAGDDFVVFENTVALALGAHGMVNGGPGEVTTGGGRWQRGRTRRYRRTHVCHGWRSGWQWRRSRNWSG